MTSERTYVTQLVARLGDKLALDNAVRELERGLLREPCPIHRAEIKRDYMALTEQQDRAA